MGFIRKFDGVNKLVVIFPTRPFSKIHRINSLNNKGLCANKDIQQANFQTKSHKQIVN